MNPSALESRLNTCYNERQEYDKYKRVLCICTAGLIRSATAAVVLSQWPFNFNTRCAGQNDTYALIPIDQVLTEWADEIVCMECEHKDYLERICGITKKPIIVLGIPDDYHYREPALMDLISTKYIERWTGWKP
jgi:predicted protein tyrosine phosphatase